MSAGPRAGEPGLGGAGLTGVLLAEIGLALALGLLAVSAGLLPVAGAVLSLALLAGLVRVRGELLGTWAVLAVRHRTRPREAPAAAPGAGLGLLALDTALGAVEVVDGRDHDGRDVALLGGDDGAWTAVLAPDTEDLPLLLDPPTSAGGTGSADAVGGGLGGLPVPTLARTLADRGVVLDALTVVRHVRPGGPDGPARAAHREVLGPLSDAAHRSAWIVVRLDPARCPEAVAARGGGVLGARRALVGSLARIGRVLAESGLPVRPLDRAGLTEAVALAAGTDLDRSPGGVQERWDAVVLGEVGHATWSATALDPAVLDLDALAAPDATTTITLALVAQEPDEPGAGDPDAVTEVGLELRVRVSARRPTEIVAAGRDVVALGRARGVRLEPMHGRQAAGLRATLPWGHLR